MQTSAEKDTNLRNEPAPLNYMSGQWSHSLRTSAMPVSLQGAHTCASVQGSQTCASVQGSQACASVQGSQTCASVQGAHTYEVKGVPAH
jgi:hypothetical protein